MNIVQRLFTLMIRVYQVAISPMIVAFLGPSARCRFRPSCSQYALEAIQLHGAAAGCWLALRRLARCHPWGACGDDPVPDHKVTASSFPASHSSGICHGS
jgi:uncharacterized protein